MTENNRNLLIPVFSDFHAPFMRASLKGAGCDFVSLASGAYDRTAALGLAHVNNDACFSTIITAGRTIMAMEGERLSVDGGHLGVCALPCLCPDCRSRDAPWFTHRALEGEALGGVRVLDLLDLDEDFCDDVCADLPERLACGLVVGDIILQLENYLVPLICKGGSSSGKASSELARCRAEAIYAAELGEKDAVRRVAEQVDACARRHLDEVSCLPEISVVGSYPAIFDRGINDGLIAKIRDEGCRAVVPFASQLLATICRGRGVWPRFAGAIEEMLAFLQGDYYAPIPTNEEHSDIQDQVLPADVATGSSILVPGYIGLFARRGVLDIAYAGTFACMSGHVGGSGVLRAIKKRYPELSVAPLEYDAGTSSVNQLNRLKLLASVARERRAIR